LTRDVVTNSAGQAQLTFEPALRASPADGTAIEWYNPFCKMFMTETPSYSVEPGYVYSLSLTLRESF
jgi:hypothetical protein